MKELLVALAVAHGADLATTLHARALGAHEANPLLPDHTVALVLAATVGTAAQVVLLHKLAPHAPRLARTLALASIGVSSGLAGWNLRVAIDVSRGQ